MLRSERKAQVRAVLADAVQTASSRRLCPTHRLRTMMLDPGAFNRARGCFTAELAALRNDACMLRLPPPTLRPPTPAQYGAARTPAQRRRGRGGPTMGCAVPSACVVAAPRKVNPLADVRTHDQAESARLPRVSPSPLEPKP